MKPQKTKLEFVRLRAEGKSYEQIAKTLRISKSTCSSWEAELKDEIAELKRAQLNELYEAYYMTREARIKKLGDTLNEIETALDNADLDDMPPEKLLDYKLKYTEALKQEYIHLQQPRRTDKQMQAKDVVQAYRDLFSRVQSGEMTTDQVSQESRVLSDLMKAFDLAEIKEKLDALEAIIGRR